jgi:hypothetical protein
MYIQIDTYPYCKAHICTQAVWYSITTPPIFHTCNYRSDTSLVIITTPSAYWNTLTRSDPKAVSEEQGGTNF